MKQKRFIDILLSIGLLLLMGYQFFGDTFHEVIGAILFVLFIVHQILNLAWYAHLFKGKYTPLRIYFLLIDGAVIVLMLMQMYSAMVISRHVFAFLDIHSGSALARILHMLGAYWSYVLISMHIGNHVHLFSDSKWKKDSVILISIYGIYAFILCHFIRYMLVMNLFVYMDYYEPIWRYYIDYIAIAILFMTISHGISNGLRKVKQ